jgi:dynein heavy chain
VLKLTDATNESKDNVRYLTKLEACFEPLYGSNPDAILAGFKPLMANVQVSRGS